MREAIESDLVKGGTLDEGQPATLPFIMPISAALLVRFIIYQLLFYLETGKGKGDREEEEGRE